MADYQYEIIVDGASLQRLEDAVYNLDVITSQMNYEVLKSAENTGGVADLNIPAGINMETLLEKLTHMMEKKTVASTDKEVSDIDIVTPINNIKNSMTDVISKIEEQFRQNRQIINDLRATIESSLNLNLDENTNLNDLRTQIENLTDQDELKQKLLAILNDNQTIEEIEKLQEAMTKENILKSFIDLMLNANTTDKDKTNIIKMNADYILDKIKNNQTRNLIGKAFAEEKIPEPQFAISERKIKNLRKRFTDINKIATTVYNMSKILEHITELVKDKNILDFETILDDVKKQMGISDLSKKQLTTTHFTEASNALTEAMLRYNAQFSSLNENAIEAINKAISSLDDSVIGDMFNNRNKEVDNIILKTRKELTAKATELANTRLKKISALGKASGATMKNIRSILEDTFKQIELAYFNFNELDIKKISKEGTEYIDRKQTERKLSRLIGDDENHKSFKKTMDFIMNGLSTTLEEGSYFQKTELFGIINKEGMDIIQKIAAEISGTDWTKDIIPSLSNFGAERKRNTINPKFNKENIDTFLGQIKKLTDRDMADILRDKLLKFDENWFDKLATGVNEELSVDTNIEEIRKQLNNKLTDFTNSIKNTIDEVLVSSNEGMLFPDLEKFANVFNEFNEIIKQLDTELEISPNGTIAGEQVFGSLPPAVPNDEQNPNELERVIGEHFKNINSENSTEEVSTLSIRDKLLSLLKNNDENLMTYFNTFITGKLDSLLDEYRKTSKEDRKIKTVLDDNVDKLSKIIEMLQELSNRGGNIH